MRNFLLLAILFIFTSGSIQQCEPIPEELVESADIWIALIDSPEERWDGHWQNGDYWFDHYEFDLVIDEINRFGVDFIISTGDNIANPVDEATMRIKLENMLERMDFYLDPPVYYIAGNHDITSYPINDWARDVWEEIVGPLNQEFWYRGTHFILMSDGQAQFTSMEESFPETVDWYCSNLWEGSLSFRHMYLTGSGDPDYLYERYLCELNVVPYVFYGHYNQWRESTWGSTQYVQTPDAKDGNVRFVHIVDGRVEDMIEVSLVHPRR